MRIMEGDRELAAPNLFLWLWALGWLLCGFLGGIFLVNFMTVCGSL